MVAVALKLIKPGTGVFQVQDESLRAVNSVTWNIWAIGRIYPPAGTYWVEASAGLQVEKRGTDTVELTLPTAVTIADGDHLFLQNRQEGFSVRVTPV